MSEECTHNCESCSQSCGERDQASLLAEANKFSSIKKVIGVISGKGGVGKSLVTSLLAVSAKRSGLKTAILDADITGPSIPRAFGLHERAQANKLGIHPVRTSGGIQVMSLNLLTDNETDPVIWRGPVISGVVKQFWTDVVWGDVDCMFIDMPPGTGDVPLTVFQSLPLDGVVIVATPQELVGMIVEKAVNMADMMKVPVLALVENMSFFRCPDCGTSHRIFGESHIAEIAERHGVGVVCSLPIDPKLAELTDAGGIESAAETALDPVIALITAKSE